LSHRRRTGALLALASSAVLLAGCGGSEDTAAAPASPPAASSAASSGAAGSAADYDTVAVPDEFGGGTIPVPPGLTPGEPTVSGSSWEIEIDGIDKDQGIAFYREALPALGYSVDTDVDALFVASDDARTVTATLSPGPDGVSVTVEPAS
jgi:hypothetical protein